MDNDLILLPPPTTRGTTSLEETLAKRRSVRAYRDTPLALEQLSQLLWAAQGVTASGGLRTAPSAGATYPLEIFVVTGPRGVTGLAEGVYRYEVTGHGLSLVKAGDFGELLADAALGQDFIAAAPVNIVIGAEPRRTEECYGRRGERYVLIEVGHAAQNIHLQCVSLGLGSVPVAAFDDAAVQRVLGMATAIRPLYIIPVGRSSR
ncbi:MAG: SagB/ThcOx family dehydrogenase [Chloroflexi bacterium]|nr:SagB/ThcOx family dehydrogenase [Chloroflexota bacterium]